MKKTISNEAWAKAVSHIVTARTILSEYDNVTFMMSVANAGDEDVEIVLAMNGTTPNLFGHLVEIMNSMVDDLPKDRALKILLNMSNAVAKKHAEVLQREETKEK
ncbi:MAG: hypothetical protein SOU94_03720 [Acidaminococcus sp.]|uniref:hypothetical protein n=1 Tax=Acidaminococcus sp. TaxID=1872103 RepID=UPI002A751D60|nr:hypothetical protein [Acidaminococcus sp.]MDY2738922.1 hypothetical protein [Acidaminococcus sp.]